jgi:hypothetical protein
MVRKRMSFALAEKREQDEAAAKIQAVYRGNAARATHFNPEHKPPSDEEFDDNAEEEDDFQAVPVAAPLPPALRGEAVAEAVGDENVRELMMQAITVRSVGWRVGRPVFSTLRAEKTAGSHYGRRNARPALSRHARDRTLKNAHTRKES